LFVLIRNPSAFGLYFIERLFGIVPYVVDGPLLAGGVIGPAANAVAGGARLRVVATRITATDATFAVIDGDQRCHARGAFCLDGMLARYATRPA